MSISSEDGGLVTELGQCPNSALRSMEPKCEVVVPWIEPDEAGKHSRLVTVAVTRLLFGPVHRDDHSQAVVLELNRRGQSAERLHKLPGRTRGRRPGGLVRVIVAPVDAAAARPP